MSDHSLAEMENLNLGTHKDGSLNSHVAICSCGWRSDPEPDRQAALDRLTDHIKQQAG